GEGARLDQKVILTNGRTDRNPDLITPSIISPSGIRQFDYCDRCLANLGNLAALPASRRDCACYELSPIEECEDEDRRVSYYDTGITGGIVSRDAFYDDYAVRVEVRAGTHTPDLIGHLKALIKALEDGKTIDCPARG